MNASHETRSPGQGNPDDDTGLLDQQISASLEALRAEVQTFADRKQLRMQIEILRTGQQLPAYSDLPRLATLIVRLNERISALERIAEPPIERGEGMRKVEKGSASDFRLLIQSEFADLDLDSVEPLDLSHLLVTEVNPSAYRKLRISSALFELPHVRSVWMDVSKSEILKLMQRDETGRETVLRILATIREWERVTSKAVGFEVGVKVDGVVCEMVEE